MKELELKLNKEYQNIGVISLQKISEIKISISSINYNKSIMDKIEPLYVEELIVVSKNRWEERYTLIDGYHRLKGKIVNGDTDVQVIVLEVFSLTRNNDTLLVFIEKLVNSTIRFISEEILVVDDKFYDIQSNEGCGGCSNGWSSLKLMPEFINKDIKVKTVESKDKNEDEYDLYINGEKVAEVDTGYGNGYYGGDFTINLEN